VIKREHAGNKRMTEDHEISDIDLSVETTIFITGVME